MFIIRLSSANRYWTRRGWSSKRDRARQYTRYDALRIAGNLGTKYVEVIPHESK